MRKSLLSIAILAAIGSAVPVAAQPWRLQPRIAEQIRTDIQQLNMQIDRAAQRRTISFREASGLRRDALNLRRDYHRFARNGLDRREVDALQAGVNRLRRTLRLEHRDWDSHRG